jgi:hypothetical protein
MLQRSTMEEVDGCVNAQCLSVCVNGEHGKNGE